MAAHKRLMASKQAALTKKWRTFNRLTTSHNEKFPQKKLTCPDLNALKSLSMEDIFWDVGNLTHPEEPWASDPKTRQGILAHLTYTHAIDEISRIKREGSQMVLWALALDSKLSHIQEQSNGE